jgi:urease accessory protein
MLAQGEQASPPMDEVVSDVGAVPVDASLDASRWRARLRLGYRRDGERTYLAEREHLGPLVVQKSLYPEGKAVCQSIVVHPPGGIAGGDSLAIDVSLDAGACAQFTTPGAAKWYRSAGNMARQVVALKVGERAVLEWLPQESIVFDGAIADMETTIDLDATAMYVGWDIVCLGRTASRERFATGRLTQRLQVWRAKALLFAERVELRGGAAELVSRVGLHGAPVFGTLLAIGPAISDALLSSCREMTASEGDVAVTRLPGLMVARYRGASCEAARACFTALWRRVRPELIGREVIVPRLWST